MMKRLKLSLMAVAAAATLMLSACGTASKVPVTGRTHRLLVTDEQVLSLSNQEYQKFMQTAKPSTNAANTAMVKRVGQRLANAVENYLRNNGAASEIKNFSWEFNLVQNKEVNAFCMPGGKIVVYEGLLPYTQNEAALAIVLGHEIAHAVAKHSAEQMSKQLRQQYAQNGISIVGSMLGVGDVASATNSLLSTGFSIANLKYSRDDESEADHMGLIFAAMAGYDPEAAIPFWQRMAQQGSGSSNDLFSDHPSDAKRIAAIQQEMPEALKYYKAATKATTSTTKTVKASSLSKSKKKSSSRRR